VISLYTFSSASPSVGRLHITLTQPSISVTAITEGMRSTTQISKSMGADELLLDYGSYLYRASSLTSLEIRWVELLIFAATITWFLTVLSI